jgi:hypothetical protein
MKFSGILCSVQVRYDETNEEIDLCLKQINIGFKEVW